MAVTFHVLFTFVNNERISLMRFLGRPCSILNDTNLGECQYRLEGKMRNRDKARGLQCEKANVPSQLARIVQTRVPDQILSHHS